MDNLDIVDTPGDGLKGVDLSGFQPILTDVDDIVHREENYRQNSNFISD